MKKEIACFLISAILPITFISVWLSHNQILPIADASNFLATGVEMYQKFINGDFIQGIYGLFYVRGWRPIAFPIITVPFFLVSKGDLLITYNCAATIIIFFCVFYIYMFLRLQLNRISASISTALICLLPSIQLTTINFFAESILLPFVIGAIYHLIKSDYLKNKKHNVFFILCVVFAILVRPIEAITNFILPFGYYLFVNIRNNKLNIQKTLLTIGIIFICVTLWYVPFYKETFEWIYRTSFGDVAASDPRPRPNFYTNLSYHILLQGIIASLAMSIMALLNVALNKFKNVWSRDYTYLLLLTPISIAEVFFTIQNTQRKIAITYTVFFMVTLMISLAKGKLWRIRFLMVALLLVFQFTTSMLIANNNDNHKALLHYAMTGIPQPSYFESNPYDKILQFLIIEHQKYGFKNVSMAIGTHGYEPIDPFVFNTIIFSKNPGFYSAYSFFSTFGDDTIAQMKGFDSIFIADKTEKMNDKKSAENYRLQLKNETSISKKTHDYFLYLYAAKKLGDWRVANCMDVISLNHENYRGCLLLRKDIKPVGE